MSFRLNEVKKFIYERLKNREAWDIAIVQYNRNLAEEVLTVEFAQECPFRLKNGLGEEHDGTGAFGGWLTYTKEEIGKFIEDMKNWKRDAVKSPLLIGRYGFRQAKDENVRVILSEKAREFLERNGIDVQKFMKELDEIKGRKATKEEIEKMDKVEKLEKETKTIKKRIDNIKTTVSAIFDIGLIDTMSQKIVIDKTVEELHREYKELSMKLKNNEEELRRLYDWLRSF